jgi:hypothetical protein
MSMRLLRIGSVGDDVRQLQVALNARGWKPALDADRRFGPLTRTAVLSYQAQKGLEVDGIVGPQTLAALAMSTDYVEPAKVTPSGLEATLRGRALLQAFALHGARVVERPLGSNTGGPAPGVDDEYSVDAITWMPGEPWCAMTAWTCFHRAGWPQPHADFAAVYGWRVWADSHDCLVSAWEADPAPGDLFLMGPCESYSSGHHIGLVEKCDGENIITIEGNCDDGVRSRVRPYQGAIEWYVRVPG